MPSAVNLCKQFGSKSTPTEHLTQILFPKEFLKKLILKNIQQTTKAFIIAQNAKSSTVEETANKYNCMLRTGHHADVIYIDSSGHMLCHFLKLSYISVEMNKNNRRQEITTTVNQIISKFQYSMNVKE